VKLSGQETTVDILRLAQSAQSLGFSNIPAGKVTQLRLYVKDGTMNYVTRDDGTRIDLKVPSGIQSGIKLHGMFDVAQCSMATAPLKWDGKRSIWVHPTGQGDLWILRPVIHTGHIDSMDVGCMPSDTPGVPGGSGTVEDPPDDGTTPGGSGGSDTPITEGPGGGSNLPGVGGTGSACTSGSGCLSGECVSGFCTQGGADAPCNVAADCVSGSCLSGSCSPGSAGGSGTPCTLNAQCLSGACVAGVCGTGGQGQPCKVQADCLSSYTCTNNYCLPPIN
jgi:hypothetical protein